MKLFHKWLSICCLFFTLGMLYSGYLVMIWKIQPFTYPDMLGVLLFIGWLTLAAAAFVISSYHQRRLNSLMQQAEDVTFAPDKKIMLTGQDELKELAELVNRLAIDQHQAEQARTRLVSDVAHELRTPLTILKGHLELMLNDQKQIGPEQIVPLLDEVARMSKLLKDLQQLSLADAGKLVLDRQWFVARDLALEVIDILSLEAEDKGIHMEFEGSSEGECYADRARLKQVLINLIGNAIRYTPQGSHIRVTLMEYEHEMHFSVIDNGPGIPPESLPYLFNRFYRAEPSRNRSSGGSGLGLSIASTFVEAHGSQLQVHSEPGKGTVFTFVLPVFPES